MPPKEQTTQASQDGQILRKQFTFDGEWLPDIDPLKVGDNNFTELTNLRYTQTDLVGVPGYSKVTNNPINATYFKGRSGIQITSPFTTFSSILTQQWDTGKTASKVYINKSTPPVLGDFEATELFTDSIGAKIANLAVLSLSQGLYCNSVDMKIFAGSEITISAFLQADSVSSLTLTNAKDYTESIRTTLTSDAVLFQSAKYYFVAATRPIRGLKFYLATANVAGSSITGYYWSGTAWESVGAITDNTKVGGVSLAVDGEISWNHLTYTPRVAYIEGMLLYFYYFTISAGSATVASITVNQPLQDVGDIWDGLYRGVIQAQDKRSGVWEDFTGELAEVSNASYPIAALWGGLKNTDEIILMFSDRTTAIKFNFIAAKVNAEPATLTIYYWNGTTWTSVGTVYDGTNNAGATFAQSGVVYWTAPDKSLEFRHTMFDIPGYAYKIVPSATLTAGTANDGVSCDIVYGLPAPDVMEPRLFGFNFRNRLFLANYEANREENRLDYGPPYMVDCFNGDDSSANGQHMLVGNAGSLLAAANIFNRFGSNIYDSELLLKASSTYILDGDNPEDFKLYCISEHVGCPAPRTLATAEVAYEVTKDAVRNIAMWVSARGPIIFDASTLIPVQGVKSYFDPTKTTCINYSAIANSHGWFDPNECEYNICIPCGVGQIECNVWLAYSLLYKKWSKRDVGAQYIPQATFQVTDELGNIYIYGLIDNGHMVRLEHGSLWNDTDIIECVVSYGEHIPTNDIFDSTIFRRVKLIRETPANADISYTRNDFTFSGYTYDYGDAQIYGEIIEDPLETSVYWNGDNLVCAEVREGVALGGLNYRITGGLLELSGTVKEGWQLLVTTLAGNFVTAKFVAGLLAYTTDSSFPGPLLIDSVSVSTITFSTGARGAYKIPPGNVTITAYYITIQHYLDGGNTPTRLVPANVITGDRFQRLVANCNRVGLTHRIKFTINSGDNSLSVKLLAWGYEYIVEREDITGLA